MKTTIFSLLVFPVLLAAACSTPKNKNESGLSNTAAILSYKDSIDRSLGDFKKEQSLPYSTGDYTFLVTKYYQDNKTAVLVEQGNDGKHESIEKRYYLRNGQLVLYTESVQQPDSIPHKQTRAFYKNGQQFASHIQTASDTNKPATASFRKSEPINVDVRRALRRYREALNQTGPFDLSFDGIIEYPKAQYIILRHQHLNPYSSALLIRKQDNFIRELINNAASYRGRKLKMNWEKKNSEYVYVSGGFR